MQSHRRKEHAGIEQRKALCHLPRMRETAVQSRPRLRAGAGLPEMPETGSGPGGSIWESQHTDDTDADRVVNKKEQENSMMLRNAVFGSESSGASCVIVKICYRMVVFG